MHKLLPENQAMWCAVCPLEQFWCHGAGLGIFFAPAENHHPLAMQHFSENHDLHSQPQNHNASLSLMTAAHTFTTISASGLHRHHILYGTILKQARIHMSNYLRVISRVTTQGKLRRLNQLLTAWRTAAIRIKALVSDYAKQRQQMVYDGIACMTYVRIVLRFISTATLIMQSFHSSTR